MPAGAAIICWRRDICGPAPRGRGARRRKPGRQAGEREETDRHCPLGDGEKRIAGRGIAPRGKRSGPRARLEEPRNDRGEADQSRAEIRASGVLVTAKRSGGFGAESAEFLLPLCGGRGRLRRGVCRTHLPSGNGSPGGELPRGAREAALGRRERRTALRRRSPSARRGNFTPKWEDSEFLY